MKTITEERVAVLNKYDSPMLRVMALMPRNICTNASGNGSHEGVIEDPEDPELWN